MRLGMMIVNILDFLITNMTVISVGLAIWNMFDESVGTDIDWLIAIIFLMLGFLYNMAIVYTVEITWNRLKTVEVSIVYCIVMFIILGRMIKLDSCK